MNKTKVETIEGTTVELEEGFYHAITPKKDVRNCARSVIGLADFCKDNGTDFLYVNTPPKVSMESDPDFCGVVDFSNQNADEFLAMLKSKDVDYYDLRAAIHEDDFDYHSCFFNTDHHWHPEMGVWAAGKLVSVLNEDYGFRIDTSCADPDRIRVETYPKLLFGMQGKRAPLRNACSEDFSLLYPDYETDLHFEIPSRGIDAYGDFSIIYDMKRLQEGSYKCPYAAFLYGDQALVKLSNRKLDNGYHVIVVHDSYANCITPFLAMGIQHVDSVDMRHFDGSLQEYIKTKHPDIVLAIYNTAMLQGPELRTGGIFDFR